MPTPWDGGRMEGGGHILIFMAIDILRFAVAAVKCCEESKARSQKKVTTSERAVRGRVGQHKQL
eukprot:1149344-Pelagomonas_calceolata.AAC.3